MKTGLDSTAVDQMIAPVPSADAAARVGEIRATLVYAPLAEVAVLDRGRFVGLVRLERLLAADPGSVVGTLVDRQQAIVAPDTDQEAIAIEAVARGARTVAVVDSGGRLLGVVPPERLLAVLEREHEEDMARLGGFLATTGAARTASEEPVGRRLWHRLPWLAVGLAGAMLSAGIVAGFEEELQRHVLLAFFVPAVVYMADAVGTQTEAVVIRGMAIGVPLRRIIGSELATGLVIGVLLAAAFFAFAVGVWDDARIAAAVAIALFVSASIATTIAMLLPYALARLGRDPAFGSGPLATVIQDLLSVAAVLRRRRRRWSNDARGPRPGRARGRNPPGRPHASAAAAPRRGRRRLLDFFRGLSEQSLYLRFHGFPNLAEALVEPLLEPDWEERGALLGTFADEGGERVVAVANYVRLRDPALAEAAFAVADEHQRRGIGTRLLEQLAARAATVGIERFVAEVMPRNRQMLGVFEAVGFELARELPGGELEVQFPIAPTERYEARVAERDHGAVTASLRPFFEARSVAVVGASRRRGSIGGELFRNILAGDFAGAAYPVNRDGEPVAGVRAYTSVEDLPETVDVAVISLPGGRAGGGGAGAPRRRPGARRDLRRLRRGRREGVERQERLLALVRAHGARLIGPNCLGIAVAGTSLNATFAARSAPQGNIGFSSQSRRARRRAARGGRGPRARPVGVRLDRQQGGRLLERPARVVGGRRRDRRRADLRRVIRQPAAVRAHRPARRAAQADPGVEERHLGQRPARRELAHRGARGLGGRRRRALRPGRRDPRATSLEELIDVATLLSTQPEPRAEERRCADQRRRARHPRAPTRAMRRASSCRRCPARDRRALRDFLPAEASVANPVDMLGGATAATYEEALPVAARRPARRRRDRPLRARGRRHRRRGRDSPSTRPPRCRRGASRSSPS